MKDLFIGILSGTSIDAIDVALVECADNPLIKILHTKNYPLNPEFKNQCRKIIESNSCNLDDLGQLDHFAGIIFAEAINDFIKIYNINKDNVKAIGSHGQTLRHQPNLKYPFSMQIGDPNVISHLTGIKVIADFRRKDIAAGGQGAPLAPHFHNKIFRSKNVDRIIINIGGISNLSILPKDINKKIIGFDSGPGNCLIDSFTREHFNIPFDKDGNIAKNGKVINILLNSMLKDKYFTLKNPKSTGTDYFNTHWLNKHITDYFESSANIDSEKNNILATITHLTAHSIVNAINNEVFNNKCCNPEIYICGGGIHNKYLIEQIQQITKYKVFSTSNIGIDPDWVEACLFAWLAKNKIYNHIDCFSETTYITGAKSSSCLGGIY